jgi:hypothetical protein
LQHVEQPLMLPQPHWHYVFSALSSIRGFLVVFFFSQVRYPDSP